MGTLNYTTTVPVEKTLGEMQTMLAKHRAKAIATQYDDDRLPVGLSFVITTDFGDRTFALPVDVKVVHKLLVDLDRDQKLSVKARKKAGYYSTPEHAARVAWRVMKDWLEAQLALIQYRMVKLDQVMLPYLVGDDGQSLYDAYRQTQQAITTGDN
jgi:hypothetical protein